MREVSGVVLHLHHDRAQPAEVFCFRYDDRGQQRTTVGKTERRGRAAELEATSFLRADQDAAIRVLSLTNGSRTILSLPGWPRFGGLDWAADGKSLWVAASYSRSGGPNICALLNVALNGKVKVMTDYRDVCFLAGIPSPDGRYLALEGSRPDSSNVWLLENF